MINANELRIGNYVIATNGEYVAIDAGGINAIANGWLGNEELPITAIPLTPEILEKAGFVHDTAWGLFTIKTETGEIILSDDYILQSTDTLTKLYFLHQLQNLYFALCGEELEISL